MSRATHVATYVLVAFGLVSTGSGAENLLKNPSFESTRRDQPQSWTRSTWAGQPGFALDAAGRTGGCVKVTSAEGADGGWSQTAGPIPPFARLRLSGWVKTENVATTTGRGVQLNIHGLDRARTRALTGTNDWTKLEVEFEVMGQDSVQVNCLFGGWGLATGTAWFDDLALEVVEELKIESKTVPAALRIDPAQAGAPISKYIYGQFIEHLGRCIYGGIWAEMLEDRKFYHPVPADRDVWRTTNAGARVLAASPWKAAGPREALAMSSENPLSGKHSLRIALSETPTGICQEELGVVAGKGYEGRVVLRGDGFAGAIRVSLIWADGDAGRQTVTLGKPTRSFKAYPLKFKAGASTDEARLEIVATGRGTITIGAVSLMPADNIDGFRRDTLELLRQLGAPIYRWPGGNFVSGYDWRNGVGDRDRRPTLTNPAWTGLETNDVGMHEFVALCRLIGSEPLITVNTGFGDAYSAAAQVEYANGTPETPMGKWRTQNGARKPLGVTWWCVGNEMWGNWQLGYMRLEHYVLKHNWIEEMMRRTDPTIKTLASGNVGPWSEGLLRNCADHMDLIAEHFYCQTAPDLVSHVRLVPNAVRSKVEAHRRYRQSIPSLQGKDIQIAFTEWNYWYGPHVFGELGTRYFMKDALGIAAGLHEYFRHSDLSFMAHYAQTVNVIGCIKTTKTAAAFDATAYPLMLYRRQFGTIPLAVSGWNEKLDVSAALTEDKSHLTLGFVNATWDNYEVTLDLNGLTPQAPAAGWEIAHENPGAYNDPGRDPVIQLVPRPATDATGTIRLKPISITVFRVPLK
ncbi:MAG: alpha-N-arabinofuranosidase [Planctomycetes bacterium]|nr:alpha-N-arabinofuranosidase [Planctomycetota bacterium]